MSPDVAARPTWRFALLPALAVAALTVVMLVCGHRLLGDELMRRALASQQQRADLLGLQLQLSLRDAVAQVQLLARSPLLRPGAEPARMRAELDHVVAQSPRFAWIGLAGPGGEVLAASRGWLEGRSIAQRPVFQQGRQGMVGDVREAVALAPQLGAGAGLVDIGEPVRDEGGAVVAVVTAHLGLGWVGEQLQLALGAPANAEAAGLGGLVLSGSRTVVAGAAPPAGLPAAIGPARRWQDADGRRWLLAEATLPSGPLAWRAVVLQSEDAALAPLRALDASMLAVGSVAALLLGAAGAWGARRLLTPWDPLFDAVLRGHEADAAQASARVQAVLAGRRARTPVEQLMAWLARDAGNLRRALDHLPVAIALADRRQRVEYVNPAYTRLLGWTTEALRGGLVGEALLEPAERAALARLYRQLGDPPGEFVQRLQALTPGGERVAVQSHWVPMFDADGGQVGALSVVHDVRPERCARVAADAMAGRLRALADAAVDTLMATLDVDGRVLEWSRGAAALSGHPPGQAMGRTLEELLPGSGDWAARLRSARIDGRCAVAVHDGERRFEGSLYALGMAPDAACFGLVLRDVGELTRLNRRLLDQEKQTSCRLAQVLHDELGQTLAALRLHSEARGAAGDAALQARIADLVVLANRQVRALLAELRPPLLDELGLVAAIDNEIRQHQGVGGEARVELQTSRSAELQRWPADVEYAVFMIAREALQNARRHAGARVIRVQIDGDALGLALDIGDDGRGFAPATGQATGLVDMRERALAIGAQLHVDGRPGHGTMVALTWEADEPHLPDR